MGTPVPIENVGNYCSSCFGPNGVFTDKVTPAFVIVSITDLERGPSWNPSLQEPINGTFRLQQEPGYPCRYSLDFDGGRIFVWFNNAFSAAWVEGASGYPMFNGTNERICQREFTQMGGTLYQGGTFIVESLEYAS